MAVRHRAAAAAAVVWPPRSVLGGGQDSRAKLAAALHLLSLSPPRTTLTCLCRAVSSSAAITRPALQQVLSADPHFCVEPTGPSEFAVSLDVSRLRQSAPRLLIRFGQ